MDSGSSVEISFQVARDCLRPVFSHSNCSAPSISIPFGSLAAVFGPRKERSSSRKRSKCLPYRKLQ
jgi:hypothetical protein